MQSDARNFLNGTAADNVIGQMSNSAPDLPEIVSDDTDGAKKNVNISEFIWNFVKLSIQTTLNILKG